jgi:signal transduction histidine kinase
MNDKLNIYRFLSRFRWPQSYLGKFLLTAFLGVHVPLIALVAYVATSTYDWGTALPVLIVAVVATLLGTLATQYIQGKLLAPVLRTSTALDEYVQRRTLPELPPQFSDEAGLLMSNAQVCITHLDGLLRLKNDLLAVLSHDTRLPISTISLASSICLDLLDQPEVDIEELRFMNRKIRDAADRQAEMMNSILMLARAEAGAIAVQREEISPDDLITRTAENIQLQAGKKEIRLEVEHAIPSGMLVMIDTAKTEQVLNNLLTNAIKFTPRGGTVSLNAAIDGGHIEFIVRDSGTGMQPDTLAQLFTPFTRAKQNGTANEKGTGLGLWICKTFTELQGGTISVESAVGTGTEVHVSLPVIIKLPEQAVPLRLAS